MVYVDVINIFSLTILFLFLFLVSSFSTLGDDTVPCACQWVFICIDLYPLLILIGICFQLDGIRASFIY